MFYRCPVRAITNTSLSFLSLFGFYRAGFLLAPGGIRDQPLRYLTAMRVIDAAAFREERKD